MPNVCPAVQLEEDGEDFLICWLCNIGAEMILKSTGTKGMAWQHLLCLLNKTNHSALGQTKDRETLVTSVALQVARKVYCVSLVAYFALLTSWKYG